MSDQESMDDQALAFGVMMKAMLDHGFALMPMSIAKESLVWADQHLETFELWADLKGYAWALEVWEGIHERGMMIDLEVGLEDFVVGLPGMELDEDEDSVEES